MNDQKSFGVIKPEIRVLGIDDGISINLVFPDIFIGDMSIVKGIEELISSDIKHSYVLQWRSMLEMNLRIAHE